MARTPLNQPVSPSQERLWTELDAVKDSLAAQDAAAGDMRHQVALLEARVQETEADSSAQAELTTLRDRLTALEEPAQSWQLLLESRVSSVRAEVERIEVRSWTRA